MGFGSAETAGMWMLPRTPAMGSQTVPSVRLPRAQITPEGSNELEPKRANAPRRSRCT